MQSLVLTTDIKFGNNSKFIRILIFPPIQNAKPITRFDIMKMENDGKNCECNTVLADEIPFFVRAVKDAKDWIDSNINSAYYINQLEC